MTVMKFEPPNHEETPPDPNKGEESNRMFLFGLLFVVVLAVAGVFLVRSLIDMVRLQDCAVTGRRNC